MQQQKRFAVVGQGGWGFGTYDTLDEAELRASSLAAMDGNEYHVYVLMSAIRLPD